MSQLLKLKVTDTNTPAHLQEIYHAKEQRTFNLVKQSIDVLKKEQKLISLTKIVAKSKELDPQGKGVSVSAIQRNEQANDYYKKHRTHKGSSIKQSTSVAKKILETDLIQIKPDRNLAHARNRYLKMTREELVDRLLVVEQALAQHQDLLHQTNDELLTLHLTLEERTEANHSDSIQVSTHKLKGASTQLRAENKELKLALESIVAEKEELKKQNQYLFNKVVQLESSERSQTKKDFRDSITQVNHQPDFPDVEY